MRRLAREKQI
jgi:hypothetical protein